MSADASFQLTFTNSSDFSEDEVFVWITAAADYELKMASDGSKVQLGHSYRLSELRQGVEMDLLVAGRIYFSFGAPLPDVKLNEEGVPSRNPGVLKGDDGFDVRHDFMELTYTGKTPDVANLTSMDQFAIPLELQLRAKGEALTGKGTSAGWHGNSDEEIIKKLSSLVDPEGSNIEVRDGRFLRVNGATKFPTLYHNTPEDTRSMEAYLAEIHKADRMTVISGSAFGKLYEYVAQLDEKGNYLLTRRGSDPTIPERIIVPASYRSGPNEDDPVITLGEAIYLSDPWYGVDGEKPMATQNDLSGAVVRDLFAALNLGYVNSEYVIQEEDTVNRALVGKRILELTTEEMRSLTVGFSQVSRYYNIYADAIRKLSDSYGFAYSDWNEHLSKVGVLLKADHEGKVADELNIRISGSRVVMAVPESGTAMVFGVGCAMMGLFTRFRRQALAPARLG